MKYRIVALLLCIFLGAGMYGCGAGKKDIPVPESWIDRKALEEKEKASEKEAGNEVQEVEDAAPPEKPVIPAAVQKKDCVHLDLSGSIERTSNYHLLYNNICQALIGHPVSFYAVDEKKALTEINRTVVQSSGNYIKHDQCAYKSSLDLIGKTEIPLNPDGLNIVTSDLQIPSDGVGEWLRNSGAESFSFYVFNMQYDGRIQFYAYTGLNLKSLKEYNIKNCRFNRDFLLIAFGNEERVREFDQKFSSISDFSYDYSHVDIREEEALSRSLAVLTPAPDFVREEKNIAPDNNNFNYGAALSGALVDMPFSEENTFVFEKSRKSANKAPDAVRILAYSVLEGRAPEWDPGQIEVNALTFDRKEGQWVRSSSEFTVSAEIAEGLPASEDEKINTALGGNIVEADKKLFVIKCQTEKLPSGTTAVEIVIPCKGSSGARPLSEMARDHSASLTQYIAGLEKECRSNGSEESYTHQKESETAVYDRLLEFSAIAEEVLSMDGARDEAQEEVIRLRLLLIRK